MTGYLALAKDHVEPRLVPLPGRTSEVVQSCSMARSGVALAINSRSVGSVKSFTEGVPVRCVYQGFVSCCNMRP